MVFAVTVFVKLLFWTEEKRFDLDSLGRIPYLLANLVEKIKILPKI
jgi:hypothetical protein